jgi:hypothetical protein
MRSSFPALLFLSLVVAPSSVLACSCPHPPPPEPNAAPSPVERIPDKDEAVFEGTVSNAQLKGSLFDAKVGDLISADLEGDSPFMLVSFDVSRSYSGQQEKRVELRTGMGGGDCGYPFEVGKQYLVYAGKDESGQLSTGICSGTGLLEDRKADIASLRGSPVIQTDPPEHRAPVPARLCGHVVKSNQVSATEHRLMLISVGDKSPVPTDEAQVNDDGSFCAISVSPGEYYLLYVGGTQESPTSFGFYPGVTKLSEAETISLKSGQQIENLLLKVPFQPSYSVSGTVAVPEKFDSELQAKVLLFDAEQVFLGLIYRQDLSPGVSFRFPQVLPGKYWAIVMVESDDNSKWLTKKVEVDVDNNVSGLALTLTQK